MLTERISRVSETIRTMILQRSFTASPRWSSRKVFPDFLIVVQGALEMPADEALSLHAEAVGKQDGGNPHDRDKDQKV